MSKVYVSIDVCLSIYLIRMFTLFVFGFDKTEKPSSSSSSSLNQAKQRKKPGNIQNIRLENILLRESRNQMNCK